MSYEGYREWLCDNGHYSTQDAYDCDMQICPSCRAEMRYTHGVDQTNGREEGCPWTMPAPKEEIGHDDEWRVDHHGNRYAIKVVKYKPVDEWRKVKWVDEE